MEIEAKTKEARVIGAKTIEAATRASKAEDEADKWQIVYCIYQTADGYAYSLSNGDYYNVKQRIKKEV